MSFRSTAVLGRRCNTAAIILLLQVVCVVHAAKTGRFWPWGYVVIFLPGFGALAYVLIELLPEWFGSVQGQKTRSRVVSTLDPGKRYRALTDQLQVADTIATRTDLAEECAEARVRYGAMLDKAGRKAEAKTVLTETLAGLKRAPKYVRRAQAEWIALAERTLKG